MAFRGVLLQLKEDESDAGFRVVSPDAELALPPRPVSGKEPPLTKWSQQKLVIADSVTKKLLQVARLATVMPQRDEKSVLWGVAAPFPAPEHRTVGAVPLASYKDVPDAVKSTHVPTAAASVEADASSLAAAVASTSMIATPTSVQGRPLRTLKGVQAKRLCYCFHFRSDFEYDLFARTLDAFTRMQRYALLKSSVLMEMEINYEQKQRQEQLLKLQAAANKNKVAGKKLLEVNGKPQQVKKHGTATLAQQKSKAKIATVTTPSKMVCVLCRMQRKPDGPEYPKHPFVLKDGKGEEVHTCKVCLQRVLQLRLKSSGIQAAEGGSDNYCGLCAHSTETMGPKTVKACTHEMCSRIYCATCIEKLIGKAQAHKVWRTKSWLCPNCSTLEGGAYAREQSKSAETVSSAVTAPNSTTNGSTKQKKRKRCNQIDDNTANEDGSAVPEPISAGGAMKPLDYAVTYFKFLLSREVRDKWEESEDVCFCCKDGGDVIECDWKGMNGAFDRCPKVYHEDCLGYVVPEGKTWVCPRHRCQDCGIIALYSCRFCVTSYCEDHLPRDVKKLGLATQDIPTSTYVVCPRCTQQTQDALKEKKIGKDLHSRLFRRRARKGNK